MHLLNQEGTASTNPSSYIENNPIFPNRLAEEDVHIWQINAKSFSENITPFYDELSQDEKERANRFHFEKDKVNYVLARSFLRRLLSKYLDADIHSIQLVFNSFGKPMLSTNEKKAFQFNLSHSGEKIIIAFSSSCRIGVDIEKVKKNSSYLELALRYFTQAEYSAICSLPKLEQLKAFYRCWTRKEAYIKAHGKGLSMDLKSFEVSIENNEQNVLKETYHNPNSIKQWSLFELDMSDEYIAALAFENNTCQIKRFDLNI